MRDRPRFPFPQRTTARAGVLLLLCGVLLLLQAARIAVPITDTVVVPLNGPIVVGAAAVMRAVAFLILALGVADEVGIVAQSRSGRAALIVWGGRDLVDLLVGVLPIPIAPAVGIALVALQLLLAAAALVAAIQVIRIRVLWGAARWALLPIAILDGFFAVVLNPPPFATALSLQVLIAVATWPTEFLEPVLTLVAAVALLVWGRTEAIKHRGRTISDAW